MVRGVRAPGEKWLQSDLALQAAFLIVERSTDRCGHPLDESTDNANSGGPYASHQYVLDGKIKRCHACAAIEAARESLPEDARHDPSYRIRVKLAPRGSAPDESLHDAPEDG